MQKAVARICREGGTTVSTNVMVRDLGLSQVLGVDGTRLEVVAEGLTLFRGVQLAMRKQRSFAALRLIPFSPQKKLEARTWSRIRHSVRRAVEHAGSQRPRGSIMHI